MPPPVGGRSVANGAEGWQDRASVHTMPRRRTTGMVVYHASEKDCVGEEGGAQECVICFEEFAVGVEMGRLECLCKFHKVRFLGCRSAMRSRKLMTWFTGLYPSMVGYEGGGSLSSAPRWDLMIWDWIRDWPLGVGTRIHYDYLGG